MLTDAGYWPHKKKYTPRMGGAVMRKRSKRLLRMLWGGPSLELIDLVLLDSASQFKAVDRYQRRALSRLKRAIEDFDTVRILELIEAQRRAA